MASPHHAEYITDGRRALVLHDHTARGTTDSPMANSSVSDVHDSHAPKEGNKKHLPYTMHCTQTMYSPEGTRQLLDARERAPLGTICELSTRCHDRFPGCFQDLLARCHQTGMDLYSVQQELHATREGWSTDVIARRFLEQLLPDKDHEIASLRARLIDAEGRLGGMKALLIEGIHKLTPGDDRRSDAEPCTGET